MPYVLGTLAAIVAFCVARALAHANELFCLSVRRGRSLVVRGALPASLRNELTAVVGRRDARIRCVREGRSTRLLVDGVDGATAQRLRNVLGVSRYRDAERLGSIQPGRRNVGQRLGWIWLAWWLER